MTKITEFNRQNLKGFTADLEKAITPIAEKYGLAVKGASGNFSPNQFSKKFEFFTGAKAGENGVDVKYKANITYADLYGMPQIKETDYNKLFTTQGQSYRFVGINTKGRRFPIIAQNMSTKKYHKFTENTAGAIALSKTYHK